ncbi:VOC family protein [Luteipulveratus sp. YIM 133132]|uniref:VOC family protein n=1 Tax=Luteipulveratus flavus TaxID=3031728 RepID=UPI0023B03FE4|nr:VOC family protein [Luteipulveratus sp. YIM 133132]MDE9367815.1 VOC family protein [Luteipulveratus sp. YIM 133132]
MTQTSPSTTYRPAGYTSLTPFLCVDGAARAIDFYTDVFGARLVSRTDGQDGTVAHAELELEQGRLQLGDPAEAYGIAAPTPGAAATHSIAIYVPDCDATTTAAEKAGGTVREAPSTFVTGDRFASVLDPFGIRWSIMTRVEDVSDEEAERRVKEWMSQQGD